jgi:hypothetical protein
LDDLIRAQQQRLRDREAERFGGLEVDHKLELGPDITASPATSIPTARNMKPPPAALGSAWSKLDQRVIYYGPPALGRAFAAPNLVK